MQVFNVDKETEATKYVEDLAHIKGHSQHCAVSALSKDFSVRRPKNS